MDVPERVASKIEQGLRAKLVSAKPEDSLRIIARLSSPVSVEKPETTRPSEFPSREEWRKDLISRQRGAVQQRVGPLLDRLRHLGVTIVAGGDLSETVVLVGHPPDIVKALELDGVAHADIDRALSLR